MSYRNRNKKQIWEIYCKENSELFTDIKLSEWVYQSESNFREFATYGFIDSLKKETFEFEKLSKTEYHKLFEFVTSYFEMDMEYFTKFKIALK